MVFEVVSKSVLSEIEVAVFLGDSVMNGTDNAFDVAPNLLNGVGVDTRATRKDLFRVITGMVIIRNTGKAIVLCSIS